MNTNQDYDKLYAYGWIESCTNGFEPFRQLGYIPVRITMEGRGLFWGTDGEHQFLLERSGLFQTMQDLGAQPNPVLGDWCAVQRYAHERGLIEAVLPRMLVFHKPVMHETHGIEGSSPVVAANINTGAIVMDVRYDFNLRRIERFVSLLHADRIPPLLILTKIDLVDDPESYRVRARSRFPDLPIFLVDSLSAKGIGPLLSYFKRHETIMLLGLSGAGKSTLLNSLSDATIAKIGKLRAHDGRGRHTTTSRKLYVLPNDSLLIDTPGLRVVGMSGGSSEICTAFSDIAALAHSCRFSDCTHSGEPGCEVRRALLSGELEQDRFLNFLQLRDEAQSWEETMRRRRLKEKALGKVLYVYRKKGRV